ncbi:MAG: transporter substrate-binding domain-containing protein [Pseudomonadota bacterium]
MLRFSVTLQALAIAGVCAFWGLASIGQELPATQRPGELSVAVYAEYPPFSSRDPKGRLVGIDVDIARALAERLGMRLSLREQGADESVEDDLRNAVWKGHYLGGGTADVMLHVPIDPVFAMRNDQVAFVAPYYREHVLMAFREDKVEGGELTPSSLLSLTVGVEIDTLPDTFLLSTMEGRLRDQVRHYRTLPIAVEALLAGEVDAVVGNAVEVQSFAAQKPGIGLSRVALPGLRTTQWDLGAAVKANAGDDLGARLNEAMMGLQQSGTLDEIFRRYGADRVAAGITPR